MTPDERWRFERRLDLSWKWFAFHADQRLRAFNFYLVLVAGFMAGFSQVVEKRLRLVGLGVGILAATAAVSFLMLEIRNHQLLDRGRQAVMSHDRALGGGLAISSGNDSRFLKHRVWVRFLIVVSGTMFLSAGVWAGLGFPGA